jgi:hypothetical protein
MAPALPTMQQQPLQIPTVTTVSPCPPPPPVPSPAPAYRYHQDDLAAFHHSHLCQNLDNCTSYLCGAAAVEEEQDDLGYYPDGVKRTLTDAQISMFRFSEIQQLLSNDLSPPIPSHLILRC